MKRAASSLLCLILLTACSRFSVESGTPLSDVANCYAQGSTSYKEVLADMGPPHLVTRVAGGFAFLYEYLDASENQVTITFSTIFGSSSDTLLPANLGEFLAGTIGPSYARAKGLAHVAILMFDDDGMLRTARSELREVDLGSQISITWLISPDPASDIGALSAPSQIHRWGRRNLREIPITLNELQSPTAGPYGFEQRATPRNAGQRAGEQLRPLSRRAEETRRDGDFPD